MYLEFWVVLILLVLFILAFFGGVLTYKDKSKCKKFLASMTDFSASQVTKSASGDNWLAFDESQNALCTLTLDSFSRQIRHDIILAKDILCSEIHVDGESQTSTKRMSQIGGALIGGLMLGGVGTIIGGLSGTKVTKTDTKSIDLRITMNRSTTPNFDLNFYGFHNKSWITPDLAIKEARHWHSLVSILIKRADEEDGGAIPAPAKEKVSVASLADELAKLYALNKQGILSDEEFQTQKTRLLS